MRVRVRLFLAVPIPQLLLSSACAILLIMKASPTAVFPHRGLAPHQFTPMSGAHEIGGPNDEECGQPNRPMRGCLSRSSSSVSFALGHRTKPLLTS